MSFISQILSENLINALGWTLVHSLWQGAAAAVGFALLMIFMRKYRSQTRYYIGVMTIMLVLAMAVVTFVNIYNGGAAGAVTAGQNPGAAALITGSVEIEESGSIIAFFKHYFNRHLPLLVTAWLLGILVLVLRFAGGFIYNQRIKVHRTRPLSKNWQDRLEALCRGIGIQRPVRLVESALVKMPMTIGHLKPVILFPLGLVMGLPRDQVEALLAHELAHISRRDYLVNIMQNLVDIVFFYHPGVRWISAHVRAERENCCDDIAVSVSGDSLNFAKALTNIQVTGRGLNSIEPAVAASGKRYGLLTRVKRLLSPPAMGSQFTEGFIGASILAVCLLTLVVSANAAAAMNRDMADMQKSTAAVESKSDDEEKARAEEEAKKKQEQEEFLARQKEKMFGHNENLEKMLAAFKEEKMALKRQVEELKKVEEKVRKEGKELSKEEKEKFKQQEIEFKKRELELKEKESLLKMEFEKMRTRERTMRQQEREMRLKEREMREQERQLETEERQKRKQEEQFVKQKLQVMQDEMRMQEEIARKLEKKIQEATEKKIEEKKIAELKAELEKQNDALKKKEQLYKLYIVKLKERQKELEKKTAILKGFETELVRDKLVEKGGDFEFKLGKDGVFINGVKQPKKVFKKYKELYKKLTGKELSDSGFQIVLNGRV